MGTEHAPLKAVPQKLKPDAPRGAPKSNPRPIGPLDAAGTVALLLRNATYEVKAAVVAKTATRKAGLIRAANAVVTTVRSIKEARHPLDKVGLHTRFTAEFEPAKHVSIDLGVGPDFNLLAPGIVDLQLLKVIAVGDPLLEAMSLAAMAGNYDHVSKADAIKVANELVRNMAYITTGWVE